MIPCRVMRVLEPTKSKMPRTDHQSLESPINPAFMPDYPTWEGEHSNFTQKWSFCWILEIHVFSLLFMWHSMWKANQRHVCYPNFKFYLLHTHFAVQHAVKCLSKQTGCRRSHAISGLPSCCRDRCVLTQCAKLATTSLSTITLTAMSEKYG